MPVLAPNQPRPEGTYISSEVAAPARGQDKATKFIVSFDLDPVDLADPTLVLQYVVEGSIDGDNWMLLVGTDWTGGQLDRLGNPTIPRASWASSDNRVLTRVRVRWGQPRSLTARVNMDFAELDVAQARG